MSFCARHSTATTGAYMRDIEESVRECMTDGELGLPNYCSAGDACRHVDKYSEPVREDDRDPGTGLCCECFAVVVLAELNKAAAALDEESESFRVFCEGLEAIEERLPDLLEAKWHRDWQAAQRARKSLAALKAVSP